MGEPDRPKSRTKQNALMTVILDKRVQCGGTFRLLAYGPARKLVLNAPIDLVEYAEITK